MIEFSSVFAQYRSFDQIYLFKNDTENQVTLEVYNLGLNRLRTRPISTASLSDIYHSPKDLGSNVKECVFRLLKEGYYPSLEGWESSYFKSDACKLDDSSMPNTDKAIFAVESQIVKKHWDEIDIDEFTCSITHCIMENPVITNCGHTFESWAIKQHFEFRKKDPLCPKCNSPIEEDKLITNYSLKDAIEMKQKEFQISALVPSLTNLFKGKNNEALAQPFLIQAKKCLDNNDYDEAMKLNIEAIKYCNKSEYYANIPLIFEKQKDQTKACLAYLYLSTYQNDFSDSLESLRKASELDSNFPELSFALAKSYKKIDKYEDAIYFYRKAAEQFLKNGKKDKAIKCYQEALYVAPDSLEQYDILAALYDDDKQKAHIYLKGALYFITKKLSQEAESLCLKARKYCSEDFLVQQPYLDLLEQDNKLEELVNNCYKLGKTFEEKNADKEAIACYEKANSISPSSEVYHNLISVINRSETKDKLLSKYLEWITFCIKTKKWEEGEKITDEALSKIGEDSELLKSLKKILGYTKSDRLQPLLLRLGEAYNKEGKFEKAQKTYSIAWDRFQDIKACFSLASIFTKQERPKEAIAIYKNLAQALYFKNNIENLSICIFKMQLLDPDLQQFDPQEKMAFHTQKYISGLFLEYGRLQKYTSDLSDQHKDLQKYTSDLSDQHKILQKYTSNLSDQHNILQKYTSNLSDQHNQLQTELHQAKEKELQQAKEKKLHYDSTLIATRSAAIKSINKLQGHTSYIPCLKVLPNDLLASGSFDKTIKIWDLKNFKCVGDLKGHEKAVQYVELLPNGLLVSGSDDHTIKIWDLNNGTCIKTLENPFGNHSGSNQGLLPLPLNRLASVSTDGVKIWDLGDFHCVKTIEFSNNNRIFGFSYDKSTLCIKGLSDNLCAIGSDSGSISIWDFEKFKQVKSFSHNDKISSLEFFPNSNNLISSSIDGDINIWDLTTFTLIRYISIRRRDSNDTHEKYPNTLKLLSEMFFVSISHSETILFDVNNGRRIRTLNLTGMQLEPLPNNRLATLIGRDSIEISEISNEF